MTTTTNKKKKRRRKVKRMEGRGDEKDLRGQDGKAERESKKKSGAWYTRYYVFHGVGG